MKRTILLIVLTILVLAILCGCGAAAVSADPTPAKAKEIGSDYIVVGRPITAAEDPVEAYRRCVQEFVG